MQIPHQLEGKQKSIDLYISFLKEHHLWSRVSFNSEKKLLFNINTYMNKNILILFQFSAVTHRGVIMSTSHVLEEFAEKIIAMLAIYNLQQR